MPVDGELSTHLGTYSQSIHNKGELIHTKDFRYFGYSEGLAVPGLQVLMDYLTDASYFIAQIGTFINLIGYFVTSVKNSGMVSVAYLLTDLG